MTNNLRLIHLQSLRHPIEESQISLEIEIHKLSNKIPSVPWTIPLPINVPLWKINSVIDRLNPQQSKSQQERKSTDNINQCRYPNIPQSRH